MNVANIVLSEADLGHVFLSILFLLCSAHFFGHIFNRLGMPRVVGEIFSGIILGPSLLGLFFPEYYKNLFNFFSEEGKILSFMHWFGLVLLMLTAGFKISKASAAKDKKTIINLVVSSIVLPTLGGILYYHLYDFGPYKGTSSSDLSMIIIICISVAITSIPVISKIFIDLDIINSRFAKIILTTATFHDLVLWVALDIAIKSSTAKGANIFLESFTTILFLGVSLSFGPYLINYINKLNENLFQKSNAIGYVLAICFAMITIADFVGINIIFGALVAGMIIGTLPAKNFQPARDSVSEFSLAFFIPIYFAIVGLKINLPLYFDLKLFLAFFFISSFLEIGSVFIGLRLFKKDWLTSLNCGVAMNARGGPGIVVAGMAYEFSIINEVLFVVLILVAIMTSLVSGVWFKFILNRGLPLYRD